RTPRKRKSEENLWPIGNTFHERIDDDHKERGKARQNRKTVELDQHQESNQGLRKHEHGRLRDRDLFRWNRPRPRSFDEPVEIAVHEIVPGAAGASHRKGTDEEQNDVPCVGEVALAHARKTYGPPARHQQKPRTDRPIESRKAQIRTAEWW